MKSIEKSLPVNTIKFYNNINNYVAKFNDANLLKQYYSEKCKILAMRGNINLPASEWKATLRCQKCCINRSLNNTKYKISSNSVKSRFFKKIMKKLHTGKLTKYQLKYAKKIQKCFGNHLVMKCDVCQTEFKVFHKPPNEKAVTKLKEKVHNQSEKVNKQKTSQVNKKANLRKNRKQNNKTNERMMKLGKFLNKSSKLKSTNLKDFIKSVI